MRTLLAVLVLFMALSARAAEIRVAAASDLKFALEDVIKKYPSKDKITAVYGSSGQLLTQIQQGAPFDIFLSADTDKVEAAEKVGNTRGKIFAYAEGRLVVYAKKSSPLKLDADLKVLLDQRIKHVAVGHPVNAPYGQIADIAMKKASVIEFLRSKLVIGESIAQTAQFVGSDAAEIGLISRSLALAPELKDKGKFVEVNPALYNPLRQSGAVLKGPNEQAAQAFADFFVSEPSRQILSQHGLTPWAN